MEQIKVPNKYIRKSRFVKKKTSKELQESLINIIKLKGSVKIAADLFKMPQSTARKIYDRYKKNGAVLIKKREFQTESKIKGEELNYVEKIISEDCQISRRDIQHKLMTYLNINVSETTVGKILKKLNYSFKRVNTERPSSLHYRDRRSECNHKYLQLLEEEKISIFYHECECKGDFPINNYGWVKKGEKASKKSAGWKFKNIAIMALIINDEINFYIQESSAYFISLVTHLEDLLDHLGTDITNITFIIDNLRFHRDGEVRQFIEERGHELLYMPPHSIFFMPINNAFVQWKSFIKMKNVDNVDEVNNAIADFNYIFKNENLYNYYEKAKNNFLRFINGTPFINSKRLQIVC